MNKENRKWTRVVLLILVMGFFTLMPAANSASSGERDMDDSIAEAVSSNCGHLLSFDDHTTEETTSGEGARVYAHCVFAVFDEYQFTSEIVKEACGVSSEIDEGVDLPMQRCLTDHIVSHDLGHRLWALAEACTLYPTYGFQHVCAFGDSPILEAFEGECKRSLRLCHQEFAEVEHLGTNIIGECNGRIHLYDELPSLSENPEPLGGGVSGSTAYFHWELKLTWEPETSAVYSYLCDGEAEIKGLGKGGFHRQLIFEGAPLCKYDGFIETECVGDFSSDHESVLYRGRFSKHIPKHNLPADEMTFGHEGKTILTNEHQGSLKAWKRLDPPPVDVPQKIIEVTVDYNVTDWRDTRVQESPFMGGPMLVTLFVIAAGVFRGNVLRRLGHWQKE